MKCTYAKYEHSRIGFPGVVLKWSVHNETKIESAYYTVNGIIHCEWNWQRYSPLPFIEDEIRVFDEWVLSVFEGRSDVQG
jgi:hypothetical protein